MKVEVCFINSRGVRRIQTFQGIKNVVVEPNRTLVVIGHKWIECPDQEPEMVDVGTILERHNRDNWISIHYLSNSEEIKNG